MEKYNSYLTFYIQDQLLALSIHDVEEIIEVDEDLHISPCISSQNGLYGHILYQNTRIPVIHSHKKFGYSSFQSKSCSILLILSLKMNHNRQLIGLTVDKVKDIVTVAETKIQKASHFITNTLEDFAIGTFAAHHSQAMIVDFNTEQFFEIASAKTKEGFKLKYKASKSPNNKNHSFLYSESDIGLMN